jgi:paraquat-inducible protein B
MSEEQNRFNALPEAELDEGRKGISVVWLLPLVAVLIGGWLVYKTLSETGPTITLSFNTAEGIEAKKSKVKFLEVEIGVVQAVDIKSDGSGVILSIEMVPEAKPWLTEGVKFWVVRPRVGAGGVSGIGTLLSGAYIGVDLAQKGEFKRDYVGLEEPPSVFTRTPGTRYRLKAPDLGSLVQGSPVLFRQIKVGEVTKHRLADDHSYVDIEIFVYAPHDAYVRKATRFWNASGVDVELNTQGLKVNTGSLTSILAGGIAFATPASTDAGERAPADTQFTLFNDQAASEQREITVTVPYVLHFRESVRGLSLGAPVEYRGIRLGTVKEIGFHPDVDRGNTFIAVRMDLEPERIPFYPDETMPPDAGQEDRMAIWVERGLRARLQTGNLLTGQLFVELDIVEDAPPAKITYYEGVPVFPTVSGKLEALTDGIARILSKLEKLPLEEIGSNLEQASAGASSLINSAELQRALRSLDSAARRLDSLLLTVDAKAGTMLTTVTQASRDTQRLVESLDAAASGSGPLGGQLVRTLEELQAAIRSIRNMADYLERHPEALLKGKSAR